MVDGPELQVPLLSRLHTIRIEVMSFKPRTRSSRRGNNQSSRLAGIVLVLDGSHEIIQLIDLII